MPADPLARLREAIPVDKSRPEIRLLAICPDCGEVELHHGRCPVCCGDSWTPKQPISFAEALRRRRAIEQNNEQAGGDRQATEENECSPNSSL
jgi:hypothetical protein